MLTPSAGIPPPSLSAASSPSTSYSLLYLPRRCRRLPVPRASSSFAPKRSAPVPTTTLPPEAPSTSAAVEAPAPFSVTAPGTYRGGEDPLVSKLRTQLGVIHPLPAPPISRSVVGLFALFFFVGAAFDKLWTLRKRRRAERELKVNGSWPQVPTPSFSLFLEKDLQRKESVEWVNMVLGKLWKVYRTGIENWIVGLLQPVIDNLHKPDYVNRVEIRQFYLGEEPLSVRNVERRTSRRANDLQYQIGIRYAGGARMALALYLKFTKVPVVVPVWVRDFDIDGELWVKLRLIPTEPWVGAVSWAFVSLPKVKFELSLFRLFNLMAIPVLSMFLTELLTEDLPRLFVRPKKIVLDFQKGRAMGPVSGSVASDIIQNVATDLIQEGNKDFVGELSVTLVDARKLSFVLFGKRSKKSRLLLLCYHFHVEFDTTSRAGKTDPYVVMIIDDQVIKSKKNSQTTVIGLPGEPIWNQDFHMLVANPRKQKLTIQVKDSIGLTDITIGTGEVELGSLKDTVPTDKIVTLYGGWGLFGKREAGEVLLRLTYKAYVEDEEEEDEAVRSEIGAGYASDEDVLDYVSGMSKGTDFVGKERETFMDLLAALLVSEEFQGIVSSETGSSSREGEQAGSGPEGTDSVTVPTSAAAADTEASTVPNSSTDTALVWLAAITSVMVLVSSNLGGSGYFNP
ncbi:Calcium-dependent lipid-binding (CaLB domain) family protein [Zea mays]|uniref:Calcium-dependent lipid-binding (CaLB domain) family protein n=1 Tax=Zea mays TaxID=4577 RepID=A0A1D6QA46_MAIZE|nr:Calcium-dependent lipid-binding (CaLB domain) family protein [Zea mays]